MSSGPIRIGIAGAGFMGKTHATCYSMMPGAKVVGISDVRPEQAAKLAKEVGAQPFDTLDHLLDQTRADAVDICLPTDLHEEAIYTAVRRGVHCIVEKPIAPDAESARRVAGKISGSKSIVMVAHVIRFWPEYEYLKNVVKAGEWGRLTALAMMRMSPRPGWTWNNWNLDPKRSGGALLDLHIHDADYLRYLLGEPQGLDACGVKVGGAWDYVSTNYHYPGMAVSALGGWNMPATMPFKMAYRATFEKAHLDFDSSRTPTLLLYREGHEVETPAAPRPNAGSIDTIGNISALDGYYNELRYFVDCVQKGVQPERSGVADAVATMELIQREILSVEQKLR